MRVYLHFNFVPYPQIAPLSSAFVQYNLIFVNTVPSLIRNCRMILSNGMCRREMRTNCLDQYLAPKMSSSLKKILPEGNESDREKAF